MESLHLVSRLGSSTDWRLFGGLVSGSDGRHGVTRGVVLKTGLTRWGGQDFSKMLIINVHMSCGSRFPPKWKRSFPTLAETPTQSLRPR